MSSAIDLIIEMITLVIQNTLGTLFSVFDVVRELFGTLAGVSAYGPLPFIVSILILGGVLFFVGKFFFSSLKMLILLFVIGLVVLGMIFMFA